MKHVYNTFRYYFFIIDQNGAGLNYRCGIKDSICDSKWGMVIVEKNPKQLHIVVKINTPVDAPIGK